MSAPQEFVDDVMGRLERLEDVSVEELARLTVAQLREAFHRVGGIGCSLSEAHCKADMVREVAGYVRHYRRLAAEGRP